MKFIKYTVFMVSLSLILGFAGGSALANGLPQAMNVRTFAASSLAKQAACSGLNQLDPAQGCGTQSQPNNVIEKLTGEVIRVLSIIVGVVSVIVIIFSGFRFITANGDSNAVSGARNTLIYAIVGLVVAVLAQFIATAVLNSANRVQSGYINDTSAYRRDV